MDSDIDRAAFYSTLEVSTMPQIWIEDKWIGGWRELDALTNTFERGITQASVTYKPFRYSWAVELTKRHEKAHWLEEEIDLSEDINDWKSGRITDSEKEFITHILRLFTQSDVAVGANYYKHFIPKIENNEVRNMLGSFASREGTHQRSYALLNDTLGLPDSEFHAFLKYTELTDKMDFMYGIKTDTISNLALGVAKSVLNEGVSLFASFAMLLNFQRFGKMKGMSKVVEWSIRDETMHVEGLSKVYEEIVREHPYIVDQDFLDTINTMATTVVTLEDNFVDMAYKLGSCEGMDADELKQYVRVITNKRLDGIGFKPLWTIDINPLPWLVWIVNGVDHTNFFENRVTEYEVGGFGN